MNNLTHLQQVRCLYKTILKLHRGLPAELQIIGDQYIRDEFKRHKKCNTQETQIFMKEWSEYAITLAKQLMVKSLVKGSKFGQSLADEQFDGFRDDQLQQLYNLMKSTQDSPAALPVNEDKSRT